MELNWEWLWQAIFGVDSWMGLNMGFWVAMGVVVLVVIIQNLVFWKFFSPYDKHQLRRKKRQSQ